MTGKRTILVVDDSKINRMVLCKILEEDYRTIQAENGMAALEILRQKEDIISVVLLDLFMPVMNGYQFLEIQQKENSLKGVPVIVTTQQEGEETEVKALSLGAHDFLTKPYKPAIIKHRIANVIKLRETAAMMNTVQKDAITGIYNKEFFYQRAAEILKANPLHKYDLICVDIEHFKLVNELFGVKEGDRLLEYVATIIKLQIAEQGICGRIGADTFVSLIEHREEYQDAWFERIMGDVNQYPININLVLRYGIYVIDDKTVPINVMCDRAKIAIDSIKGKYEVYFTYYDDSIRTRLFEEQMITDNMKKALKEEQFQVYFQPQYHLASEKVSGAEALVRWIHPEKGFMSPASFIPLFEKNGFITDLDMYVWECVCKKIRQWLDEGKKVPHISVNVSRADIYNPNLFAILNDMVKKYGLSPECLHLEITESAYTDNQKQIIEVVRELREIGFIIEMDDFGTGYSSLNMLSELTIDVLKLDMSFLHNALIRKDSRNILNFIIILAKWLNLTVVAEGVETLEQVQMLRNMECDFAQGYYYARPLVCEEFELLLEDDKVSQEEVLSEESSLCRYPFQEEGDQKTLLIVEDSEAIRTSLVATFEKKYRILQCENGQSALNVLRTVGQEVDIILMDLIMPLVDGFQVLEEVKNDSTLSEIPIIAMSEFGEGNEGRAFSLGAVDFMTKPCNQEVALCRVENSLKTARLQGIVKSLHATEQGKKHCKVKQK